MALSAFHRICLVGGPDYERTVALAGRLEWNALPASVADEHAPVANPTAFQGWTATGEDIPEATTVGVTKATLNGKPVETCTVAVPRTDGEEFAKRIFERTDAERFMRSAVLRRCPGSTS